MLLSLLTKLKTLSLDLLQVILRIDKKEKLNEKDQEMKLQNIPIDKTEHSYLSRLKTNMNCNEYLKLKSFETPKNVFKPSSSPQILVPIVNSFEALVDNLNLEVDAMDDSSEIGYCSDDGFKIAMSRKQKKNRTNSVKWSPDIVVRKQKTNSK